MGRASMRSVKHLGISVNARVSTEVGQALIAEASRHRRSLAWAVEEVLQDWYEAVYVPAQQKKAAE